MGQFSEKKIESIINSLKESSFFGKASLITASSNTAVIALDVNKKSLLIEPQKITYACYLEDEFDKNIIQNQFEVILNTLLIDDFNQYLINLEGTLEAEDSHKNSRELYSEKYMPLKEEIYGVGYRFLVKNSKLFGEFKIEPLVTDKNRYYFQWILNKSEYVTIADMLLDVQEEIEKDWSCCYNVIRS